ncbi:MAG: hypothetical protein AMXMBFR84_10740 [Candidatus Hydrogenedentota bacterium]
MQNDVREQARDLLRTIRLIKARITSRNLNRASCCCGSGSEDALELTIPQLNMLAAVRDRGQVTIKDLAEALEVSAPSASTMVDRLVDIGAVTREQSQVDRREVVVQLTEMGDNAVHATESLILEFIVDLLEKAGPETARMWCTVYDRIGKILEDEQPRLAPDSRERTGVGS